MEVIKVFNHGGHSKALGADVDLNSENGHFFPTISTISLYSFRRKVYSFLEFFANFYT